MNDRSAFRHVALTSIFLLLAALLSVLPAGTLAQTPASASTEQSAGNVLQVPLEPSQLPKDTIFYVIWRGTPPTAARTSNHLLSLWDDPEFAPVRSALAESLLNNSGKSANARKPASAGNADSQNAADSQKGVDAKPHLTREEIAQVSSLLENPFVLGYFGEPAHAFRNTGTAADNAKRKWNGFFFVYNRSGKEELLAKTILRMRASQKELPKISAVTLAGVSALKIEEKNSTTYWAEDGKYAISANEAEVFEHLALLLQGKTTQAAPLTQTVAYQEARPLVGAGVLEFFLRVPDVKEFVSETDPKAPQVQTVLSALKLDSLHSVSGHLAFEGARTRITGAILGDASPGTLFDLWEEGQATPASLAYVPPDAVHYQESQFNLLSLYRTVKRGFQASSPQGQQGMADLFEAMIQTRIGMPLPDALGLLSGEFASLQTSPTLEPKGQTYFIGIRDKQASLKLLRTLLGDRISSERNEGDTTYLKFSLGGSQGNAGVMQWNFFHLAVTPDLILASSRRDTLQQEIANRANSKELPVAYQAARAQFPQKLNSVSFVDFQKLDWQALKDKLIAESAKTSRAFQEKGAAPPAGAAPPTWLLQFNPQVVPRHLHVSTSASWKDSKGIHFDGWIE